MRNTSDLLAKIIATSLIGILFIGYLWALLNG